jgi:hypothetical protein
MPPDILGFNLGHVHCTLPVQKAFTWMTVSSIYKPVTLRYYGLDFVTHFRMSYCQFLFLEQNQSALPC